jgi:Na+/H+ antiporter NhaD/arsenite permease-like protein
MSTLVLGTVIFIAIYVIIAAEWWHKTLAALIGGLLMILLRVLDQEEAFHAVDWNVIFLLVGMMLIAHVTAETGVFQWLAIRAAKLADGQPFRLLILLMIVTAVASAFLDNVTTVVLIVPVTIYIADVLGINPKPFLLAEVLASNIGGASTLIGDPPNILIGSAANLGFNEFIVHMAPPVTIILALFLLGARFLFRRDLAESAEHRELVLALDERKVITDPVLLRKALFVLAATIGGFLVHRLVHLEPATIALTGAAILLIWTRFPVQKALAEVEWTTLLFFVGLFIMVEGVVKVGLIDLLAERAIDLTGGALAPATFLILWLSLLLSGIVDNIPYTATMIPLVQGLQTSQGHGNALWWALALGADLGGNATLIGASANIIVANLASRAGHPITFREFLGYGLPVMFLSGIVATVWVWLRYLL